MPTNPKTITIGTLTLGPQAGQKVIAPIVARTYDDVLTQAHQIVASAADMLEWRLDYLTDLTNMEQLIATAKTLRTITGQVPIIATNRTSTEGGQRDYQGPDYQESYTALITHKLVDAIDIEFSQDDATYDALHQLASDHHVTTILSHHDFAETPEKDNLIFLFAQMAKKAPSIVKVAVTPHAREDVMALMDATLAADHQIEPPIIAMSMGRLGRISRLAGDTFGSIATFGTVGAASAPGQASVAEIKATLTTLAQQ